MESKTLRRENQGNDVNTISFPHRSLIVCVVLALAFDTAVYAGRLEALEKAGALPKVFSADPQTLRENRAALAAGDATLSPALNHLLADADEFLNEKPPSVMDEIRIPPSGDRHDYISQAPYFWRDTNSPAQKYVSHDGERNPEAEKNPDARNLAGVCYNAHALALAYYFTGDKKYSDKAATFIRVWFLDPATRMNPNLNYGQGIPGGVQGRPAGLITARCLADLVDAVGLLAGSGSWQSDDQREMITWAENYLHWLTTSKIGLGEDAASNNHGTYYDVQMVSLALFLGNTNFAHEKLMMAQSDRIAKQIEPDGQMPRELARTLSYNYCVFNLTAEMQLADLARSQGIDTWHFQSSDGRSLLKAVEFMAQYADPAQSWPYQQIHGFSRNELDGLLLRAAVEYPGSKTIQAALPFCSNEINAGHPEQLYLRIVRLPAAKLHLGSQSSGKSPGL